MTLNPGGIYESNILFTGGPDSCGLWKFRLFKRQLRRSGHVAGPFQDPEDRLPEWALQRNVVLVELLFAHVLLLMRACRHEIEESEYILRDFSDSLGCDNPPAQAVFQDNR